MRKSARRHARELVVQGLYGWFISSGQDDLGVIESNLREQDTYGKADIAVFESLLHGVVAHQTDLQAALERHLDRPVAELSLVEYSILVMAAYELIHCLDVPYRVVLNEAVEICKDYGGTDGFKFVNAVLDKLCEEYRAVELRAGR